MVKLKSLEKDLKKVRAERDNLRLKIKYHRLEREKLNQEKDFKSWKKHNDKIDFFTQLISRSVASIEVLLVRIEEEKNKVAEKSYRFKLEAFDKEMYQRLEPLMSGLLELANKYTLVDLDKLYREAFQHYVNHSPGLSKRDLIPYKIMSFDHTRRGIGTILELHARSLSIEAPRNANLIDKVKRFSNMYSRIIGDCLETIKKRSLKKNFLKKLRGR